MTTKTTKTKQERDIEALRRKLDAVSLELEDVKDELKNTKDALAASVRSSLEANRHRVIDRPHRNQEVFVILKFQQPQPLPDGAYRLFWRQQKAVDRVLDELIAKNPKFGAIRMEELRFECSPRGQFVYQHMKDDKSAPIEFSRTHSILKDGKTEEEMVAYVRQVFHMHTQNP
ncbi:hypothetical protein BGX26_008665 [Mortierella sp. AD094]|nr:hypothetical protein BGX26_008665 [Mortierella sp. AD094]